MQEIASSLLKEKLVEEYDLSYDHIYFFYELFTGFGFETICNMLRDDGSAH